MKRNLNAMSGLLIGNNFTHSNILVTEDVWLLPVLLIDVILP